MRAIWSGTINFGLVNIPIKLYPGTEDKNLNFDYLHKKDLSKVRYAKICEKEEKEISYDDLVRGFEFREGEYVVVEDEDLKNASPEKTDAIEILNFAKQEEIESIYFDNFYYVEPEKQARKAYYLLLETLKATKSVGIASFILRTRESLAALKVREDILILNKLRYQEEIREYKELEIPKSEKISKAELEMAQSLVEKLTSAYKPETYRDTYREKLEKFISNKAKGRPLPKPHAKKAPSKVSDIMSLLKESLEEAPAPHSA